MTLPPMAPLDGVFVVSLDQAVAAPYAASRLAELGARVVKVERPDGDFARAYDTAAKGESAYFVWLNRGKESIALDIKQPADKALLLRMIAQADVFIQNLAPGAAARAGIGADALRAQFPGLITCDVSGYGEDGPYRDMKAYDLLIQAESALASITGSPDAPGRVGVSIVDIAAGMTALNGILAALIERGRTGKGQGIKVSLFDAIADWMSVPLIHHEFGDRSPQRVGLTHPGIAPYGAYKVGDDAQIVIAIQNQREWQRLCAAVLGDPSLYDDARFATNEARVANRPALDRIIDDVFSRHTVESLRPVLESARVAFGAVNDLERLSAHPQLRRATVATPSGDVPMPAPPVIYADSRAAAMPVPKLDQHGPALRAEFAET